RIAQIIGHPVALECTLDVTLVFTQPTERTDCVDPRLALTVDGTGERLCGTVEVALSLEQQPKVQRSIAVSELVCSTKPLDCCFQVAASVCDLAQPIGAAGEVLGVRPSQCRFRSLMVAQFLEGCSEIARSEDFTTLFGPSE